MLIFAVGPYGSDESPSARHTDREWYVTGCTDDESLYVLSLEGLYRRVTAHSIRRRRGKYPGAFGSTSPTNTIRCRDRYRCTAFSCEKLLRSDPPSVGARNPHYSIDNSGSCAPRNSTSFARDDCFTALSLVAITSRDMPGQRDRHTSIPPYASRLDRRRTPVPHWRRSSSAMNSMRAAHACCLYSSPRAVVSEQIHIDVAFQSSPLR